MNLRDFKYVIAVAETQHFGKAAERCFVSQPTLSGQIKKLEEELGVVIFERTKRSVEVTVIGREIIGLARKMMEQADAIDQLAQAHSDPLAGSFRIGALPTISPYLMPLILIPLRQQYPKLKLVLSEEVTDALIKRLRSHELDAAIIATAVEDHDLETIDLFDEPFWLAHPSDHDLYYKEEITRQDLANLDVLLLSDDHCLAKQAMEVFGLQDRPINSDMGDLRASSLETLLQLVGAGFGCTLVPALAVRGFWMTDSGVIARKLNIQDASRRVSLVFRHSYPRRQVLEAFADLVKSRLPNTVKSISAAENNKTFIKNR
jgi:LysR family hydrogen peroxide-inducible transcriptional activator